MFGLVARHDAGPVGAAAAMASPTASSRRLPPAPRRAVSSRAKNAASLITRTPLQPGRRGTRAAAGWRGVGVDHHRPRLVEGTDEGSCLPRDSPPSCRRPRSRPWPAAWSELQKSPPRASSTPRRSPRGRRPRRRRGRARRRRDGRAGPPGVEHALGADPVLLLLAIRRDHVIPGQPAIEACGEALGYRGATVALLTTLRSGRAGNGRRCRGGPGPIQIGLAARTQAHLEGGGVHRSRQRLARPRHGRRARGAAAPVVLQPRHSSPPPVRRRRSQAARQGPPPRHRGVVVRPMRCRRCSRSAAANSGTRWSSRSRARQLRPRRWSATPRNRARAAGVDYPRPASAPALVASTSPFA